MKESTLASYERARHRMNVFIVATLFLSFTALAMYCGAMVGDAPDTDSSLN
jgi:hypothetical protein